MAQLFKNNAFSALGASLTNVATSLTVTTGTGDRFPAVTAPDFMLLTLQDASSNIEVVKVTARTTGADAMTITRAHDGTTARAWNLGDVVELRLTSSALNPLGVFAGAATAADIKASLSLGNVSNTSDADKPISTATQTALDAKQDDLLSSVNIKTVNGSSLLGSGDLAVGDVTTSGTQTLTNKTLTSPISTDNVQVISIGTTAVRSRVYVLTASLTLALPTSPAAGDWVTVVNRSGTLTPVIGRGGQNIMGLAEDMTLDNLGASLTLVFADATRGWVWK